MKTDARRTVLVAAVLAAVAPALALAPALPVAPRTGLPPGSATGTVTVNGKKAPLAHAYAALEENPFEEKRSDIVLVLTEAPIPADVLAAAKDLSGALRQAKLHTYLMVKLREKKAGESDMGRSALEGWSLGSRMLAHAALGEHALQASPDFDSKLEPAALGRERVEGVLSCPPQTEFKETFEYRIAFNTAVKPRKLEVMLDPKSAQRLPAGGGEPGKAFVAFVASIQRGDIEAIKKSAPPGQEVTPEMLKQLKEMLPMMQAMTPKAVKVLGGLQGGDKATLEVEGTVMGEKQKGTIEMALAGGAWRQVKQSWQ